MSRYHISKKDVRDILGIRDSIYLQHRVNIGYGQKMNLKWLKCQNTGFLLTIFLGVFLLVTLASCTSNNLKIIRSETFFTALGMEPENLHPIRSVDAYSSYIRSFILESLLQRNKDTYEWEPQLAKRWEVSPDGKIFTFELYNHLKWSDGKPLTTKDVKFSFEAYKNPEYGGIKFLTYFENIKSAKILSDTKIQFEAKQLYFGNFNIAAGMHVIPEHIYKDPKAKLSKTLMGSGPYVLHQYIRGKILVLKKNPLWKGKNHPVNKDKYLFKALAFRFIRTAVDTLLRMEKGHIDYTPLTPESFMEKTNNPPWETDIKKVKYSNKEPSGYRYIGLNLKKSLFQDKNVRKALAHLMNRELMNKKFMYNQNELARGPVYFWNDYAHANIQPIKFNPPKAIDLLKAAGWEDRDRNGVIEKSINGGKKEFAFTILFASPEQEKYLTLYQENLKHAGIKVNLKILDWTSLLRLLDDRNFDALLLGWQQGGIDWDPKQIWHTDSSRNKGSNFISYSNPKVDALIDKGRSQMDKKERVKTFQEVYRLIAEDVPYIFMFNSKVKFYAVNRRVKTPTETFNYQIGQAYWNFNSHVLTP